MKGIFFWDFQVFIKKRDDVTKRKGFVEA